MILAAGSRLGHYEILSAIGAGGMGEVYEARDLNLGRRLAIKVFPDSDRRTAQALARFAQEARSASSLNHPNILTVYEVVLDSDPPYIAMELVEGESFRQLLTEGALPIRKLLHLGAQVAEGLAAAHEKGIVHRDLKPENLMLSSDGFVKILDFGLAKLSPVSDSEASTFELGPGTKPGTVLGTVGYMSPEQANGEAVDFRSDQFSFGAILYELTTGRKAFQKNTFIDTMSAIVHEDPEPIERINPRAPAPFRWIVDRCLAKDPQDRYDSTRDLARELKVVRERLSETTISGETPQFRRRFSLRPAWAFALIAVVAVAAGASLYQRGREESPKTPAAAAISQMAPGIAVLPFADLGADEGGSRIAAGIADTISARLSQVEDLPILPPFHFVQGSLPDARIIARDFGVEHVLTGTVQQANGKVRVTWTLVDAAGVQRGAQTETGEATDLFALQDRLAAGVLRALKLRDPAGRAQGPADAAVQDRYLQALGYLQRYDHAPSVRAAIDTLETLDDERREASILALLSRAYLAEFRLTRDTSLVEKARVSAERAAVLDPEAADVQLSLGEILRESGRFDEASRAYHRALARQPSNAEAVLQLAELHKAQGNRDAAERSYRRAIEMRPSYWGGYNKLGAFYMSSGRYPEAIREFETVVRLSPENARGFVNLGALHYLSGDYEKASVALRRSIEIQPTASALSNLGTCAFFLGRYEEAAESYERAVALSPENFELWANLGDARRWLEEHERSREAYETSIRLAGSELEVNPSNAAAHGTTAVCFAKLGRFAEARRHVEQATALGESDVNLLYQASVVWHLVGEPEKALTSLERALEEGYSLSEAERDPEIEPLVRTFRERESARPTPEGKEAA